MSEEEIINELNHKIEYLKEADYMDLDKSDIEIFQGVIDLCRKKDKVIDLMAISWKQDDIRSIEEIKEYFYKKVEEENE